MNPFAQLVAAATSPKKSRAEQCRQISRIRPPLPEQRPPRAPGAPALTEKEKAEIRSRYEAHMVERIAAGRQRAQRGFVINLAHEFRATREYVALVLKLR